MNLDHLFDDKEGVLLVDLSQIALATVMQTYEPGMKFTVPEVRHMILSTLKHNAFKFKNEGFNKVVICIDNARYGYWRRQEQDYYKRNRAIAREESAETFDWDGYFEGLSTTIQELKDYMPYIVLDVKHAEADDCIAVLAKYLTTTGNFKVRIISSDGDFTQLHKLQDVDQYSPMQKKLVKVKTKSPEMDCMVKILKGDRKDCVAAIKVRGDFWLNYEVDVERTPPTATSYIEAMVGKTDEQVYETIHAEVMKKVGHKKHGVTEALKLIKLQGLKSEDFEPFIDDNEKLGKFIADAQFIRFKQNRVLIDFDYIRQDMVDAILETYKNYKPAPRGKMYGYFVKSGMSKLLKDINQF